MPLLQPFDLTILSYPFPGIVIDTVINAHRFGYLPAPYSFPTRTLHAILQGHGFETLRILESSLGLISSSKLAILQSQKIHYDEIRALCARRVQPHHPLRSDAGKCFLASPLTVVILGGHLSPARAVRERRASALYGRE